MSRAEQTNPRTSRAASFAAACSVVLALTVVTSGIAQAGWTTSTSVVPGRYADAEVFRLPDGRYRMLYGTESEVPAAEAGIYSSVSSTGRTWRSEGRVLAGSFSGPDVVRLPTGGYRMYLNGLLPANDTDPTPIAGVISYSSPDGTSWRAEAGLRLPSSWLANGERFGFTSTMRLPDGTWLMAYEVDTDGQYARNVPSGMARIWWATSTDGLTFTRRGLAVRPNNTLLLGTARSPELFRNRLYFHSLKGIFRVAWDGAGFTRPPQPVLAACKDPGKVFPWTPPPADPTLARIGGTTMLFHGDHTRGIFRTVRRSDAHACFTGIFVP